MKRAGPPGEGGFKAVGDSGPRPVRRLAVGEGLVFPAEGGEAAPTVRFADDAELFGPDRAGGVAHRPEEPADLVLVEVAVRGQVGEPGPREADGLRDGLLFGG